MIFRFLSWIWRTIWPRQLDDDDEYASSGNLSRGLTFKLKRCLYGWIMKMVCRPPPKKVGTFRPMSEGIERSGFIATPEEWETALPKKFNDASVTEKRDEISFYGGNNNGDYLWLSFVNYSAYRGEVELHLVLADGRHFTYGHHPFTHAITEGFNSGPLRVTCVSPFRRWRISFNGRLRQANSEFETKLQHVRFSFWFIPTQLLYDVGADTHRDLVTSCLAEGPFVAPLTKVKRYYGALEAYEQCGMFNGTVSVSEEEELEVAMWGVRFRDRTNYDVNDVRGFTRYFGRLQSGQSFRCGVSSFGDIIRKLKHGYLIHSNRTFLPIVSTNIELKTEQPGIVKTLFLRSETERQKWTMEPVKHVTTYHGTQWELTSTVTFCKVYHKGKEGCGFIQRIHRTAPNRDHRPPLLPPEPIREVELSSLKGAIPQIVTFDEEACQCSDLTGGKGASLSLLHKFSKRKSMFRVPRGLVLTTSFYNRHLEMFPHLLALIQDLQKSVGETDVHKLKEKCARVAEEFERTKLTEPSIRQLKNKLISVYGDDFEAIRFAVRSSAIGEDSEETSAAGQMVTYLGVRGINKVCESIAKCWASQFLLTAVQYKRQNGVPLNPGMAVVIQEMVPADIAGVAFTCDPVTGDPSFITITANYGLGESVVSASVEPDTIRLARDEESNITLHSITVGKKDSKITLAEEEWTLVKDLSENEATSCCLPECIALELGRIAVEIEQGFNNPRDLEWAVVGHDIFMLQSRPVTTLHRESDYDILHELDVGLNSDFECWTKANVGEVCPGALTPMTVALYFKGWEITYPEDKKSEGGLVGFDYQANPYSCPLMSIHSGHAFINIYDITLRFVDRSSKLSHRTWEIALLGRLLEDRFIEAAIERHGESEQPHVSAISTLWTAFFTNRRAQKYLASIPTVDPTQFNTAAQLNEDIKKKLPSVFKGIYYHIENTEASSTFNNMILETLADHYDNNIDDMMKDVALILSSCSNLESADIPAALQALAMSIANSDAREEFINMDVKEAVKFLQEDKGSAGKAYAAFIQRHAHRCLKEFDFASVPWGRNPENLVSSVQQIVRNTRQHNQEEKKVLSAWESVSSIKYKASLFTRIRLWFLALCARYGVQLREESKSMIVKNVDFYRGPLCHLGELLVQEGKLPDPKLIFYLNYEELCELIDNHSSKLVNKARRRQKMWAQAEKFKFPEITEGVPKPVSAKRPKLDGNAIHSMKGITVSLGVARGIARVIVDFEECKQIQQDDILITYSTDIGWSPYFPLLAGIVTELGGLVSHGAVVAREYGLPCLVGVEGATAVFKSGDYVVLDANQGVIKKVDVNVQNGS